VSWARRGFALWLVGWSVGRVGPWGVFLTGYFVGFGRLVNVGYTSMNVKKLWLGITEQLS